MESPWGRTSTFLERVSAQGRRAPAASPAVRELLARGQLLGADRMPLQSLLEQQPEQLGARDGPAQSLLGSHAQGFYVGDALDRYADGYDGHAPRIQSAA